MKASIEDPYGNVVTTASSTVSVAFANNPTGATLGGTLSVTASQGVASFTNLTINKIGSGYTLRVSSSGLTSATSNPINVTKNGRAPTTLFRPGREPGHGSLAGAAGARQPGSLGRLGIQEAFAPGLIDDRFDLQQRRLIDEATNGQLALAMAMLWLGFGVTGYVRAGIVLQTPAGVAPG